MAHQVEAFGEVKSRKAWSEDVRCVVGLTGLRKRLDNGWGAVEALTTPAANAGSPNGRRGDLHMAWGEEKSILAWSKDSRCKVSRTMLRRRLDDGWDIERALATPKAPQKSRKPGKPPRLYGAFGEERTINDWANQDVCVVDRGTLSKRLVQGASVELALTTPAGRNTKAVGLTAWGETDSYSSWAKRYGIDSKTISDRLASGMSPEDAISTPARTQYITSHPETSIANFLESLGVSVVRNSRSIIPPYELDLYLPDHDMAVEYNGLYWHSEQFKGKWYHHNKWKACNDVGIQLVQVWEDDYLKSSKLVCDMLIYKLGQSADRVYARKCEVSLLTDKGRRFFREHHIQGPSNATVVVGLTFEDELVAACAFKRLDHEGNWDLVRYATSVNVVGGFTKCLKFFERNFQWSSVRTFADLTVSDGGLYETSGFNKDKMIDPDYKYIIGGTREHKFNFRVKRFKDDPSLLWQPGLSERQLAELNGLHRIWDAGKLRYIRYHAHAGSNTPRINPGASSVDGG